MPIICSYARWLIIFLRRILMRWNSSFGWNELQEVDVNNLQLNRYIEARSKGQKIPVVGISDGHTCEESDMFGPLLYYLFCSSSLRLPDLIKAIKERSVAIETPAGGLPRAFGPYRLLAYAHFLLRYVLPVHDELCYERKGG